jgi:glycosyltransferase involved in cell wall biosynthesis
MSKKIKLFYFAPHPVQYHVGIYRELAKVDSIDFKVIYEDNIGIKPTYVKEFNKKIKWDIDPLGGYSHEFMKNYSFRPHGGFFSRVNLGIFKFILKDKPDVVIFKGYTNFSDWMVMLLSLVSKTKIIFRGEANLRGNDSSISFKKKYKKIILINWLKLCDVVMYSCTGNREYWEYYGVDKVKMFPIPCAVDNDFFREQKIAYTPRESEIKKTLGICSDNLIVLFSARFTSRKRPLDLLKAISNIDHSNITVLFVGDGPERSNMEKYVQKHHINAIFTGFVNQTEISKYYSISNLNVVISDYDPSPKAMNEAMNFKLPIIVTDIVGTAHDLVKDGKNGFVVKVGDIDLIAEKIDFLNKNRKELVRMGNNSFDIVEGWNFKEDVNGILGAIDYITEKNS